jgi:hypothetical protein
LTPEEQAARDQRLREIAVQQDEVRRQRNEDRRRIREERLYARRKGR